MTLFEATLRLVLAAMPLCVAFAALLRLKQSRSANRYAYALALFGAVALAGFCGPDILFARDLPLHFPLMALLSAPLWALLTGALEMAQRSSGYAWGYRKKTASMPQRPRRAHGQNRAQDRMRAGAAPALPSLGRQIAQNPRQWPAPQPAQQSNAMPIFRTSRLQS
ncbi:MAG: hypothetical protein ACRBBK_12430 [Paracoccaceae bacterium]